MGATATGIGAAVGSGAFFTAEADRGVSATVTTDDDAFLSIEPVNEEYAEIRDGELVLDFADNGQGEGVAPNSEYRFGTELFRITNQGTQEVELTFEDVPGADNPTLEDDDISWGLFVPGFGQPYDLPPGEDGFEFGSVIETGENPPESASFEYRIVTEQTE